MPTHYGPVIAERDGLTVRDCRVCGWAHLDPLPIVPNGYYESEFWQKTKAGWRQKHESEMDWLQMRHFDWLTLAQDHTDGRGGRILLDVGSGWGFFLKHAGQRAWRGYGIEPSIEAANYSREHTFAPIHNAGWEDYDVMRVIGEGPFDCISALWLMEHLPNPHAFLSWCRAHLAPGGVLLLAVPQEWTSLQEQANCKTKTPNWWLHPTHINYWSAATLYGLLGRCGFKVVEALATYPIERLIIEGQDYVGDEKLGDEIHSRIRQVELMRDREHRLWKARRYAHQAIGRDLIIFAKVDA